MTRNTSDKLVVASAKIPERDFARLVEIANESDRTVSYVIRRAIAVYLSVNVPNGVSS